VGEPARVQVRARARVRIRVSVRARVKARVRARVRVRWANWRRRSMTMAMRCWFTYS
jgi:hypothetical protein